MQTAVREVDARRLTTQKIAMPDTKPGSRVRSPGRQTASNAGSKAPKVHADADIDPPLIDAELVQLRVRVIALENLVISLLAQAPERQLAAARQMAIHISPRPGFTAHPMTVHAAAEMNSLVRRAEAFRSGECVPGDDAHVHG